MINYELLKEKYGSPLYIYDLDEVSKSYEKLVNSLPDKSIIYYSLKANPNPEITRHLINLGCYAEISSIGELNIILDIGAMPEKCIYTGPGKTKKEIEYALSKDINHFSIESLEELNIINNLTKEGDRLINITLRINPSFTVGKASIKMTGIPSQFGFDEKDLNNEVTELIVKNKNLKINGFHIYNGSNFNNIEVLEENFKSILTTVLNLKNKLSIDLNFIDFGGGFAAPFGKIGVLPDYTKLKGKFEEILDIEFRHAKKPTIAFESGRYLTATCGKLMGTVQSMKKSKGKTYCIVDFGINHIGGMSGLRRIPTIELQISKADSLMQEVARIDNVNIVGPLCTPLDYLAKNVSVSNIKANDIVYVSNVGAYGLTASLLGFLSRELPKELIIKKGKVLCAYSNQIIRGVDLDG
ncbi:decarboxylase [Bacillus mycoides]|uniref:Decarboxylase n=1 Tax=Bacillus mycoides TaxID=1405 RepID=A0A1S9T140_BACMY|nr:decarboxylase [Bacillus mycoides]OOR03660.1 decarboxylase [Bacillus mycoides]